MNLTIQDYELIDEKQAAMFLGMSHRSLQGMRVKGGGPNFVRVSPRMIRYRRVDLIAWSETRLHSHTMEYDTRAAP